MVGAVFGAIMAYGKSIATRLRGWLYGLSRSNKALNAIGPCGAVVPLLKESLERT
jgi:hypothetical protein